jgi:hypothetical protein
MERTHVSLLREMGRSGLLPVVVFIRSIRREPDPFLPKGNEDGAGLCPLLREMGGAACFRSSFSFVASSVSWIHSCPREVNMERTHVPLLREMGRSSLLPVVVIHS